MTSTILKKDGQLWRVYHNESNTGSSLISPQGRYKYASKGDLKYYEVQANDTEFKEQCRLYTISNLDKISFNFSGTTLLGSDPEVFVLGEDETILPAWTFLDGKPLTKIPKPAEKAIAYWDGFQAEFMIYPDSCIAFVVDAIQLGLRQVLTAARMVYPFSKLTYKSVIDIPKAIMDLTDDGHAGLGCNPSLNVYGVDPLSIASPRDLPFRFAGGHLHFSFKYHVEARVMSLDQILGPISVSMFDGMDDPRRRIFYGRAGEYRTPAHGFEYRTLSSSWLAHPILTHIIFDLARAAAGAINFGYNTAWDASDAAQVQHILNDYDIVEARKVLQANDKMFTRILECIYAKERIPKVKAIITEGAKQHLPIDNMEQNWRLNGEWLNHSNSENAAVNHMSKELLKA